MRAVTWAFETRYPLFTRIALVAAWIAGIVVAILAIHRAMTEGYVGEDAHAYWVAVHDGVSYDRPPGAIDAYLYSPAFALLITPLGWLPWPGYLTLWIAINAAALVWLLLRVRVRWAIPMFLLCMPELVVANVFLLIAACLAVGLRHPAAWSFPVLTKVTPGIGLLWFVVRRQWRPLAIALTATVVVVLVCVALDPGAWLAWWQFLTSSTSEARDGRIGLAVRAMAGIALMWWGARTGRAWVVAVAVMLATPVSNLMALTILAAIPRLAEQRVEPMRRSADAGEQSVAH